MKFVYLVFSILLFSAEAVSQKYNIEKEFDWIKNVNIPNKSLVKKYDVSLGYYCTLLDCQVNLDLNASYSRMVLNVVSYSGVTKASQLSVIYDTSYQQLKIHHLFIWRNGVKIDRTKDLDFKILNNEYNLHNGIYTGLITVHCNLKDIRKDDLIDFAYTLLGKNPIFKNEKYLFIPLGSNNPIDLYSVRILYSKDKEYSYKCTECDSTVIIDKSIVGDYQQLEMNLFNVKVANVDDNIPSWVIPFKYFSLSSFKSWSDVNNWAMDVFALQKEPALDDVFEELFTDNETLNEKVDKIVNYVQDNISYMGIESGIGSIKPFPPELVVRQRFGDCKDKSLLLVSLLKKIGIVKAYPVLVNTYMKKDIEKLYPSNEVFNHCIVKFELNDTTYWVDPTFTQQGGNFKNLSIIDYGKVLVIGVPSDTLSTMTNRNFVSGINIVDEYTMKSFTEPATLVLKSIRRGFEADIRRLSLEQHSAEELSKLVTEDLKRFYPIVNKSDDVEFNDDIEKNIFTTTYSFELDGFWQDGDKLSNRESQGFWIFKFEPYTLYSVFKQTACNKRKFEYLQDFPLNMSYQVIFHFPKEILLMDRYAKNDNEAFCFDEKIEQLSSNSFQVSYSFNTKSPSIKVEDYEKVCEEKNKISKDLPIIIYFKK